MKKVIITGASGFIGYNFIKKLLEEKVEIWAIVYPGSRNKERLLGLNGIHYIECNINELDVRSDEFPKGADAFYHLAWQGVDSKERDNFEFQLGNINICLKCMKFAACIAVQKFILPGSTSEYLYYGKPINEQAVPSPQNAYGSVKVALRYLA